MLKDVNELQIGGMVTLYGNVEIVSIYIDKVIGLSHRYTSKGAAPVILLIVICVLIFIGYLNKYNGIEKLVKIDCYIIFLYICIYVRRCGNIIRDTTRNIR